MPEFRLDRLATLYFFRTLRQLWRHSTAGIPVLMYHSISAAAESDNRPYFRTRTEPRVFRRHVEFLARNGYRAVGLSQAIHELKNGGQDIQKLVVFTFDDGYANFWSEAYPVLNANGYTATVFLPTAYIGDEPKRFNNSACLTWSQVRELSRAGVEFGSHTVTHPQLADLPTPEVERELRVSKATIEEKIGAPVTAFAYPFAFPDHRNGFKQRLQTLLAECGYRAGVCTTIGTARSHSDPYFLERLPINTLDDEAFFAAKIDGAYDWLRYPQKFYKSFMK